MFEHFTDRARKVMALANQEALRLNHEYIGTEHILLGLVKEGRGCGANVLQNLGADLASVQTEVNKFIKLGPDLGRTTGKLPQTPRAKKVIEYAIEEARHLNHNYVGTEHLLLGFLRNHDNVAAQILLNLGLNLDQARKEVLAMVGVGFESSMISANAHRTSSAWLAMQEAKVLSQSANPPVMTTVHLLLGLLSGDCLAQKVLGQLGVTPDLVRQKAAGLADAED